MLVAHDRWFLEAVGTAVLELEAGALALLQGHLARLAQGAGGARAGARPRDREAAGRDRAHRAFVERFRARRRARARRRSRVKKLAKIERIERDPRDGTRRSASSSSSRSARAGSCSSSRTAASRSPAQACCSTTPSCGSSAASTSRWWAQRRRQDDADRHAGGPRARSTHGKLRTRPQRQARLPQPARRGARVGRCAHGARGRAARTGLTPNKARALLGPLPVQRRGRREAARRAQRRRAAAAVAGDPRQRAAPTS